MAMGKSGAIIMLLSLFAPVWMAYVAVEIIGYKVSFTMVYWLFGFTILTGIFTGTSVMATGFVIEPVSLAVFGAILVFSILAIVKEGTTRMVMGLVALGAMGFYLIWFDLGYGFLFMMGGWYFGELQVQVVPIGGAICIIGAIFTAWGGAKNK